MCTMFYGNIPKPLSDEEIREQFIRYSNGDMGAKNIIIKHNIRLVISIIRNKYSDTSFELNELVSVGLTELIKCVDKYDVSSTTKFSTYSYRCINNAIHNYIRDNSNKYFSLVSLSTPVGDEESTLEDYIKDDSLIEENYDTKESYQFLNMLLDTLTEREKDIMMMYFGYYGKKYTFQEIGDKYGVTKPCIRQIVMKKLKQLKEEILKSDHDIIKEKKKRGYYGK